MKILYTILGLGMEVCGKDMASPDVWRCTCLLAVTTCCLSSVVAQDRAYYRSSCHLTTRPKTARISKWNSTSYSEAQDHLDSTCSPPSIRRPISLTTIRIFILYFVLPQSYISYILTIARNLSGRKRRDQIGTIYGPHTPSENCRDWSSHNWGGRVGELVCVARRKTELAKPTYLYSYPCYQPMCWWPIGMRESTDLLLPDWNRVIKLIRAKPSVLVQGKSQSLRRYVLMFNLCYDITGKISTEQLPP